MPRAKFTEINYSDLDAMETENLERLLRLDAQAPKGLFPEDMVLHILEILVKRGEESGEIPDNAAQIAYEKFLEANEKRIFQPKVKRPFQVASRAASVLAIFTALFIFSITGYALGHGGLQRIAMWTAEVFSFADLGTNKQILAEVEDQLERYGSRADLVPTWVPDGFTAKAPLTVETPKTKDVFVSFENGTRSLCFSYTFLQGESLDLYEKSDSEVELFEVDGVTHYLFANNEIMQAVWLSDSCECNILGNITKDELKEIIQSIYR